jgi:hypothetical protein
MWKSSLKRINKDISLSKINLHNNSRIPSKESQIRKIWPTSYLSQQSRLFNMQWIFKIQVQMMSSGELTPLRKKYFQVLKLVWNLRIKTPAHPNMINKRAILHSQHWIIKRKKPKNSMWIRWFKTTRWHPILKNLILKLPHLSVVIPQAESSSVLSQ